MLDGILSVSEASELFIDGKAVAILYMNGQEIWPLGPAKRDGLGLRALQDGSRAEFLKGAGAPDNYFLSSFDRRYWGEWDGSPVDVPTGKTLWIGALSSNQKMSNHAAELSGGWTFSLSGGFAAVGKAQALLDQNYSLSTCPEYGCTGVFRNCHALKDASQLELPPVKSGGFACFNRMFAGSGISAAPSLSGAEFVPEYGMQFMFYDCDSLLSAPALPALTVSNYGCDEMFNYCGEIRQAGQLSARAVGMSSFRLAYANCPKLSAPPPSLEVTGTLNKNYCFYRMFRSCTSLLSTPDMKFTSTYNIGSAGDMFNNCRSLSCVRTALTSWGTRTGSWLDHVASDGIFICPSTLGTQDTIRRGPSYCPSNWRVYNPDLKKGPWWRLTIKECYRKNADGTPATSFDSYYTQLDEFYMYDQDGNRVNGGLQRVDVSEYSDFSFLQAGQVCRGSNMSYGTTSEMLEKMFDGSQGSKWAASSPVPVASDPSTWIKVVLRLADDVEPVSYNFKSANDGNPPRNLITWSLEHSQDGISWNTADEKTDYTTGLPFSAYQLYNEG